MKTSEELLNEKTHQIISVTPEVTVGDALRVMTANKVGSILIMENDKVLGIWTERDLLHNVLTPGFNVETSRIGEYMVKNLQYARHSDPAYILMDKFLGLRFRHILIEKDGEFLGMLSMGDVVKGVLRDKFKELHKQNHKISWEYYEEWKWEPKD